jgi:acid phosphatase (class A)
MSLKLGVLAAAAAAAMAGSAPAPASLGYLSAATAPDTIRILPAAPTPGTTRFEADRTVYLATRSLKDTPRWAMAQSDVNEAAILKDLACAVGVELTPRTAALLAKMRFDVHQAVNGPKDFYQRKRPFLVDPGPTCTPQDPALAASPDYPSGHATWGWSAGLVMAELAPDRASDILVRARAFGDSRVVCGVHTMSAVEAGRLNATAVVAALHGSPEFRSDLDAARREVAAARRAGPAPDPAACAQEAALTAKTPY